MARLALHDHIIEQIMQNECILIETTAQSVVKRWKQINLNEGGWVHFEPFFLTHQYFPKHNIDAIFSRDFPPEKRENFRFVYTYAFEQLCGGE